MALFRLKEQVKHEIWLQSNNTNEGVFVNKHPCSKQSLTHSNTVEDAESIRQRKRNITESHCSMISELVTTARFDRNFRDSLLGTNPSVIDVSQPRSHVPFATVNQIPCGGSHGNSHASDAQETQKKPGRLSKRSNNPDEIRDMLARNGLDKRVLLSKVALPLFFKLTIIDKAHFFFASIA